MRTGTRNIRLLLLFEVTLEYNSGSEFEHYERLFFYGTTLRKTEKEVKAWIHRSNYRWNEKEHCFVNRDPNALDMFLRIDTLEQAYFVDVVNGSSLNLKNLAFPDYTYRSNGYFEIHRT
jgi:hypothetical protein